MKSYIFFFVFILTNLCSGWEFIDSREKLDGFKENKGAIMVCSPGRSGSTLLADTFDKTAKRRKILKSHLLPPKGSWKGKIIFIYSNPDKAAESILHGSLSKSAWDMHFDHVETSDLGWLKGIGSTVDQTLEKNLLAYDALGTEEHLRQWLYFGVEPCSKEESCILAVKYEHLWEKSVILAIRSFCGLKRFEMPKKIERGYDFASLPNLEQLIRETYNLGTLDKPRYAAYDGARAIWESAPEIQYFNLRLLQNPS